jgi:hypothetical protein
MGGFGMPAVVCAIGLGVGTGATLTARMEPVDAFNEAAPSRVATKLCKHFGHLMCKPSGGILLSVML